MEDCKRTMYYLTARSNERQVVSEGEATVLAAILPSRARRLAGPAVAPSIMDTSENRNTEQCTRTHERHPETEITRVVHRLGTVCMVETLHNPRGCPIAQPIEEHMAQFNELLVRRDHATVQTSLECRGEVLRAYPWGRCSCMYRVIHLKGEILDPVI